MHSQKRMRPRVPGNANPRLATAKQGKPRTESGARAQSMMVVPKNLSEMQATSKAAGQLARGG